MTIDAAAGTLSALWADLDGDPQHLDGVVIDGPPGVLASVFDVTGLAAAAVGAAALAVAEVASVRTGAPPASVAVDRLAASASFRFEALVRPDGWELPPVWDPIAGDYRSVDGWIRLHTNYRHHRQGVLEALGLRADGEVDRAAVAAAVAAWTAADLEEAVVAAGGCAAAMRTTGEWAAHGAGLATVDERPVIVGSPVPISGGAGPDLVAAPGTAPLAGVRVLDLTRVIAGPVATRYLAGYGADVLRIDPPGFEEVGALLPEVTAGKRCAALDLARPADRRRFEALVARAHVVVGGLRPGALEGLGLGIDGLRAINPALIVVHHDAYGWSGPWQQRRGFDSLVQMSTGIAAAGAQAAGTDRPTPLPAQALDHGLGHLLAAGACRALTRLVRDGEATEVRGSLVGVSNVLRRLPAPRPVSPGGAEAAVAAPDLGAVATVRGETAWGPLDRVPLAGRIAGASPRWPIPAGPLGRHEPTFAS